MNIVVISENTVIILFRQIIDSENFKAIKSLIAKIKLDMNELIIDIIPSYASIHITFDLLKVSSLDFKNQLHDLIHSHHFQEVDAEDKPAIQIPAYYGEEVALDLPFIAERAGLSVDDVVSIHSEKIYDVYAIGFSPGFAYLGNVDESICTPRKETPRKKVARGSLGIADQQTAVYPSESPGGWQIIGRTPIHLIDYGSKDLTRFSSGDKVKFNPICKEEYIELGGTF